MGQRQGQELSLFSKPIQYRRGNKINKENSCEQLKSSTSTGAKCSYSNEMHTDVKKPPSMWGSLQERPPFKLLIKGVRFKTEIKSNPSIHFLTGSKNCSKCLGPISAPLLPQGCYPTGEGACLWQSQWKNWLKTCLDHGLGKHPNPNRPRERHISPHMISVQIRTQSLLQACLASQRIDT